MTGPVRQAAYLHGGDSHSEPRGPADGTSRTRTRMQFRKFYGNGQYIYFFGSGLRFSLFYKFSSFMDRVLLCFYLVLKMFRLDQILSQSDLHLLGAVLPREAASENFACASQSKSSNKTWAEILRSNQCPGVRPQNFAKLPYQADITTVISNVPFQGPFQGIVQDAAPVFCAAQFCDVSSGSNRADVSAFDSATINMLLPGANVDSGDDSVWLLSVGHDDPFHADWPHW